MKVGPKLAGRISPLHFVVRGGGGGGGASTGIRAKARSGVGDGSRPWPGAGHCCDQLSRPAGVLLIGLSRPLVVSARLRLSEPVGVISAGLSVKVSPCPLALAYG